MSYRGVSNTLSAKDAMKAQMDALMGRDRNLSTEERARRKPHFSDPEHNKHYLAGLCPYSLFTNTKDDLGPPPASNGDICEAAMKAEYDKLSQEEKNKYGYEYNLFVLLRRLVTDLDRRIVGLRRRLADQDREVLEKQEKLLASLSDEDRKRLDEIDAELITVINDAERLAEEGDVDGSFALIQKSEELKSEKAGIHRKLPGQLEDNSYKKHILCEVSGNYLSITDSAERLRNHFEGKRYIGWKKVRAKYEELRAKNLPPGIPGWNPKKAEEDAERKKRRAANPARPARDRDQDKDRDRDRSRRDRDRDRTRDRSDRDRDRDRRSRDRRDRDRSRRNRSRSRSRDRRRRR